MDRDGNPITARTTGPFLSMTFHTQVESADGSIKVRTAQLLVGRSAMPPVSTRASVVGAERSRSWFEAAYAEHARRIARAIIRDTDRGTGQLGQEVDPI